MSQKPHETRKSAAPFDPVTAFAPMAPAAWMSTAWFEALSDLGAELTSFVADRIQQDVQTQHALLHCRSLPEVQKVQAEFLQNAFDQYQAETGKLIEMTGKMAVGMQTKSGRDN